MVVILVAHIHDLKNCQKSTASVDASVDPFAVNISETTSFPRFSHEDAWVNTQLRSPSATTMSFSYQAVSSGRSGRANLCQRKVSE